MIPADRFTDANRRSGRARAAATKARGAARHGRGDPTVSAREYDAEETAFLRAMADYQHRTGRKFPTWTEALAVLKSLGYRQGGDAGPGICETLPARGVPSPASVPTP
jgi:hypothetical protein